MEDRYLFKAKRLDNGEWIVGYLYRLSENNPPFIMLRKYGERYEVDEHTICQCTGLRDKNGNLIYEHDVAKAKYSDGFEEITEVAYSKNGYSPYLNEYECEGCCCRCEVTEIEVIGNIFDNPELLESEG